MLSADVRENLCTLIDAYCKATKRKESYISSLFYGNSKFFGEFRAGKASLSVKTLDEIVQHFRDDWPADTPWPNLKRLSMSARKTVPDPKPARKIRG